MRAPARIRACTGCARPRRGWAAAPIPGGYPLGGETRIELPNDHLQYAITWFALAIALVVIYLVFHHQRGRLDLEDATQLEEVVDPGSVVEREHEPKRAVERVRGVGAR